MHCLNRLFFLLSFRLVLTSFGGWLEGRSAGVHIGFLAVALIDSFARFSEEGGAGGACWVACACQPETDGALQGVERVEWTLDAFLSDASLTHTHTHTIRMQVQQTSRKGVEGRVTCLEHYVFQIIWWCGHTLWIFYHMMPLCTRARATTRVSCEMHQTLYLDPE
jgi:hypothetical protein